MLEQLENLATRLRVEIACWLVREDDRRLVDERTADCHALLLAARQLRRPMAPPIREADPFEQLVHPRLVRLLAGD